MAYVYRHVRLDKNEVFYVGIGSDDEGNFIRANFKYNRNIVWHRIVAKTDYIVEIVLDDLTWEEACKKEKEFIKLYGRKKSGGTLCNLTDGGEGILGYKHSPQSLAKLHEGYKKRPRPSEITKKKIGAFWAGKVRTKEFGEKISKGKLKCKWNNQKLIILNTEIGTFYYSVYEAAEAHNFKYHTLWNKLTGRRSNNTNLIIT